MPCGVFDTFALGLIGKKISSTSGDARRALELASKSITFCLEDIPDEEMKKPIAQRFLDGAMSEPIVTLNHVMKAVRETIGQRLTESIYALPESAKVILCVGVTLRQCLPASEAIRVGELATFCKEASRYSIMEEITKSEFLSLVHLLVDSGLFTVGNTSTISRDYYSCAFDDMTIVNFDVQLHDLECALATTLMDRPFYRKMAEYVEQKYGRL